MNDGRGRFFGGIAALAVLWIFVYWWWEPRGATISFDPGPPAADVGPALREPTKVIVDPVRSGPSAETPATAPVPHHVSPERPIVGDTGPAVPAMIPPQFREYTIREGDTFEGIARRELGSARHAAAIIASNPMMNAGNLRIGRTIRIPVDPGNIQGKPNPEAPAASTPEPPDKVVEYTVKSGDTLSRIAREFYGSTSYDEFIYLANRDRLSSKDDLRIGEKLRLPPKEER